MTQICERDGFPTPDGVAKWCEESPEIALEIARARDEFFDRLAVDCLTIADNTGEDPASRRVRVETRLKLLAKWCLRRYGDAANPNSQTVNVAVGVHVLTEEQRAVLVKARREALAGTGDGAGRVIEANLVD